MRDPSPVVVAEVCYWDGYCWGAMVISCGFLVNWIPFEDVLDW